MALNILICLLKDLPKITNFPKSILGSVMGITLKIMTLTKYKDLKLMGLYLLKLLIKNDQVDSQNFSEIGTTCIEFLKKRDFKFATTAAKSLTYLFDKGLTLKLQASSVKKLFKKMLKIMNE